MHTTIRLALLGALLLSVACDSPTPDATGPLVTRQGPLTISVDPNVDLQTQIDAANPGDTLLFDQGSYYYFDNLSASEAFRINKPLTLRGQGPTALWLSLDISAEVTLESLHFYGQTYGRVYTTADIIVEDVTFESGSTGLVANGSSTVLLDRVVTRNNFDAGVELRNVDDAQVINSMFLDERGEGLVVTNTNAPTNIEVSNNLFLSGGHDDWAIALCEGFDPDDDDCGAMRIESPDNVLVANNILVGNKYGLNCEPACLNDHNLIWANALNYVDDATAGPNNLNVDPRFTNPGEDDFTLRFDSPAIDAGNVVLGPGSDYTGKPRPIGASTDIGPHEYGIPSTAPSVALTEIMANPLDERTGEYLELYNFGDTAVDVAGWVLDDGDATDTVTGWMGGATTLAPGAYGVILDPDYPGATYMIGAGAVLLTVEATTLGTGLSNNDTVHIRDGAGNVVDSYSYPFNAGNGVSVERDTVEDGDIVGNWVASPCGHSPGAQNCASLPTDVSSIVRLSVNEVMANPLDESTGEFIEIYNWGDVDVDLAGLIISDGDSSDTIAAYDGGSTVLAPGQYAVILDPDYTVGYTLPIEALLLSVASSTTLGNGLANNDPISLLTATGLSVIDSYSTPFNAGNGTSVEKVDPLIIDLPSNFSASTCASGSSPGRPNCVTQDETAPSGRYDLLITEVMANPLDEDTGEFVEIFNFGDDPVDLAGFRLSDGDKEEALSAFVPGSSTVLASFSYAVVVDAEYDGSYPIAADAIILRTPDTTIGSGLSTNDPIRLRAPTGADVIAAYSFPFNPGNGTSVERGSAFVGDLPQNWVASPCILSPGADNCAYPGGPPPDAAPISTTGLVIAEVMANPLDESTGEFVEIFNAGPVGVDVAGWQLTDGDATDTIEAWSTGTTIIGPGKIGVILDPQYANDYVIGAGTIRLKVGNNTIGNGLTTTDPITLFEADGTTVVDRFSFPTNPGNGRSIEKVTLTSGDVPNNWSSASCDARSDTAVGPYFASPGRRNCVDPYGGISGTNALGQTCPFGASDCASGLCALELQSGGTFCTQDCTTNACASGFECTAISDVNYAEICVPSGGGAIPDVVINEILYDSEGADDAVFIEIKGDAGTILDGLTLVGINGANGQAYTTLSLSGQISSSGYFVVADTAATGALAAAADLFSSKVDFQNGPDSVQLRQGDTVIDAVGYGSFAAAIFAGEGQAATGTGGSDTVSLSRSPEGTDSDDNSVDFAPAEATPGAANGAGL